MSRPSFGARESALRLAAALPVLSLCLGLAACGGGETDRGSSAEHLSNLAWSPDGRRLTYVLENGIYVVYGDGSGHKLLTRAGPRPAPAWSADSRSIVFVRSPGAGDADIYVMRADGRRKRALTRNGTFDGSPAWSPDGERVAYLSGRRSSGPFGAVALMNADGSDNRLLTRNGQSRSLAWSPDGRRLVFVQGRGGAAAYVADADGSDQRRVTPAGVTARPTWSPDGRRILVVARPGPSTVSLVFPSGLRRGIYVVNADGTGLRLLTEELAYAAAPAWSPDGRRIAFDARRDDGPSEIYVMRADGSNQRRLTDDGPNSSPVWSPTGRKIAFVHDREIHVMGAVGENRRPLTG